MSVDTDSTQGALYIEEPLLIDPMIYDMQEENLEQDSNVDIDSSEETYMFFTAIFFITISGMISLVLFRCIRPLKPEFTLHGSELAFYPAPVYALLAAAASAA